MPQENLLNEKEAASYLGFSVKTLQDWRSEHRPPAYYKIRKSVRYARKDLDAFLETHKVSPTRDS